MTEFAYDTASPTDEYAHTMLRPNRNDGPGAKAWYAPNTALIPWVSDMARVERPSFGLPVSVELLMHAGDYEPVTAAALRCEIAGEGAGHVLFMLSWLTTPTYIADITGERWYRADSVDPRQSEWEDSPVKRIAFPITLLDNPRTLAHRIAHKHLSGARCCRDVSAATDPGVRHCGSVWTVSLFRAGASYYGLPLCKRCAAALHRELWAKGHSPACVSPYPLSLNDDEDDTA